MTTLAAMPADQVDWIRTVVWPPSRQKTDREFPIYSRSCRCSYGPTAHCTNGNHDSCRAQEVLGGPCGYLIRYQGKGSYGVAEVFEIGHPHNWRCDCPCHPSERGPIDGALFALPGAR